MEGLERQRDVRENRWMGVRLGCVKGNYDYIGCRKRHGKQDGTVSMFCHALNDRQRGMCSISVSCSEQTVDFKNNQQCTQDVFFGRITASMCTAHSGYWESWCKFSEATVGK